MLFSRSSVQCLGMQAELFGRHCVFSVLVVSFVPSDGLSPQLRTFAFTVEEPSHAQAAPTEGLCWVKRQLVETGSSTKEGI